MFQWRVLRSDYTGELGLALAHPLYIAASQVLVEISRDHLPFLLNAFSGVAMAVALANLAVMISLLTQKRWVGLLTAAMLGVAHSVWWLSTIAEVYTWSVAGLTGELLLLVILLSRPRWYMLVGLALLNGVGLCVHNFALLPLPVYIVVALVLIIRRKLPAWSLAAAAGAYLAGSGLYLGMIAELAIHSGDWAGAIRSGLLGDYSEQVLNLSDVSKHWKSNIALSAMNFGNLLAPLAAVGWVHMRRRLGKASSIAIAAITLIHIIFFIRYPVPDQFTFILPTLVMFSVAAGIGLDVLGDLSRRWRIAVVTVSLLSVVWQPAFFVVGPELIERFGSARRDRELPFRDEGRYWLVPWKHNEQSARLFAEAALREASPNGVIFCADTASFPLLVVQELQGLSPQVTIQYRTQPLGNYDRASEAFRAALGDRPLYAVTNIPRYVPQKLLQDAEFNKPSQGVLYRVLWKDR